MKKKKIVLAAVAAMLALTACGSKEAAQPETEAKTEAQAEETSAEAESSEEAAETEESSKEDKEEANDGEEISVKLAVPKAPPVLPVLHMIDAGLLGENVQLDLDVWDAPEQLIAMVQDGEHQMFAFPLTVVSKLYNKGLDVRLTNVNTWGVTYFLTTDPDLKDWAGLKGKTVYVPLQSSPPDALTQYFLKEAGLEVGKDVEIVYSTTAEIAQMLGAGTIEYATLIEPQATAARMKNENVRTAFSFEEEWKRVKKDDSIVPNAGFGTLASFAEENPEFIKKFEAAYEESLNWVLENPAEAGALAEEELGLNAKLVETAIPNMGLLYKGAAEAKTDLDGFYQLLFDFEPQMIGGKIPDEAMYYQK